jgi:hypothetical protein
MESGRVSFFKRRIYSKGRQSTILSSNISATAGDVNDLTQNKLYSALYRWAKDF